MSFKESLSCAVLWRSFETSDNGAQHLSPEGPNIVTNLGKESLITLLFALSGSSTSSAIVCAAGSSSTAASVSDTRLGYEHIANSTRRPLTNTSGAALSPSDIESGSYLISGITYTRRLVCQAVWDSSDLNVGAVFREYALATNINCPGTPTGTSGSIINRYVDAQNITKTGGNSITIQISFYF